MAVSAMQKHASEQDKPVLLHEQLPLQPVLHLHVVNSSKKLGAGCFVMYRDFSVVPSLSHPWPSGGGRFCMAIRAFLQTKDW